MSVILCFLLVLSFFGFAGAKEYYVSSGGTSGSCEKKESDRCDLEKCVSEINKNKDTNPQIFLENGLYKIKKSLEFSYGSTIIVQGDSNVVFTQDVRFSNPIFNFLSDTSNVQNTEIALTFENVEFQKLSSELLWSRSPLSLVLKTVKFQNFSSDRIFSRNSSLTSLNIDSSEFTRTPELLNLNGGSLKKFVSTKSRYVEQENCLRIIGSIEEISLDSNYFIQNKGILNLKMKLSDASKDSNSIFLMNINNNKFFNNTKQSDTEYGMYIEEESNLLMNISMTNNVWDGHVGGVVKVVHVNSIRSGNRLIFDNNDVQRIGCKSCFGYVFLELVNSSSDGNSYFVHVSNNKISNNYRKKSEGVPFQLFFVFESTYSLTAYFLSNNFTNNEFGFLSLWLPKTIAEEQNMIMMDESNQISFNEKTDQNQVYIVLRDSEFIENNVSVDFIELFSYVGNPSNLTIENCLFLKNSFTGERAYLFGMVSTSLFNVEISDSQFLWNSFRPLNFGATDFVGLYFEIMIRNSLFEFNSLDLDVINVQGFFRNLQIEESKFINNGPVGCFDVYIYNSDEYFKMLMISNHITNNGYVMNFRTLYNCNYQILVKNNLVSNHSLYLFNFNLESTVNSKSKTEIVKQEMIFHSNMMIGNHDSEGSDQNSIIGIDYYPQDTSLELSFINETFKKNEKRIQYSYDYCSPIRINGLVNTNISNSKFFDNYGLWSGVIHFQEADYHGCMKVNIVNSVFSSNTGQYGAGGIFSEAVELVIEECSFFSNKVYIAGSSDVGGGAIRAYRPSKLAISQSKFVNNTASFGLGGAIYIYLYSDGLSNVSIKYSTQFLGNQAIWGGGLFVFDDGNMDTNDDVFEISVDSKIQENIAMNSGGGIYFSKIPKISKNDLSMVVKNNYAGWDEPDVGSIPWTASADKIECEMVGGLLSSLNCQISGLEIKDYYGGVLKYNPLNPYTLFFTLDGQREIQNKFELINSTFEEKLTFELSFWITVKYDTTLKGVFFINDQEDHPLISVDVEITGFGKKKETNYKLIYIIVGSAVGGLIVVPYFILVFVCCVVLCLSALVLCVFASVSGISVNSLVSIFCCCVVRSETYAKIN